MQDLVSSEVQALAQVDWMIAARLVSMQWLGAVNVTVSSIAGVRRGMMPSPKILELTPDLVDLVRSRRARAVMGNAAYITLLMVFD
jgi:hypothetical protein